MEIPATAKLCRNRIVAPRLKNMRTSIIYLILTFVLLGACTKPNKHSTIGSASPASVLATSKIVDLTHAFSEETIYWVTAREFQLDTVFRGFTDKGYFYAANNYAAAEHGGTHIDAPIHFAEGRQYVDEIPVEQLMGEAIKVTVTEKVKDNPDYLVGIGDFLAWEKNEGQEIPEGAIILLETGFGELYPDKQQYLGTCERGEHAVSLLHFPGLAPEAARWLMENRSIHAIGIDTPSIDYGQSQYFESHVTLLSQNIPAFENLANLKQLPARGFLVIALPMKIKGGSGAPLRIIALLDQ